MPSSKPGRRPKKTSPRTSRSPRPSTSRTLGFRPALEAVAAALAGRRWYIFGAQAVLLYGAPRLTGDIDVTVEQPSDGAGELVRRLTKAGFVMKDIGDVDSFVESTRILPFVHRASDVGLDIVLSGPGIEDDFHARSRVVLLGRTKLRVIDVNDLVTLKLLASRPKDLEDVQTLIRIEPEGLSRSKVEANLRLLEQGLDVSDLLPRLDTLWPC